jgi:hypothetical protein
MAAEQSYKDAAGAATQRVRCSIDLPPGAGTEGKPSDSAYISSRDEAEDRGDSMRVLRTGMQVQLLLVKLIDDISGNLFIKLKVCFK